jgi:UDP-GlcNAc:undecaprenyl-phosphate GlcNAc-1-phosphate transferase
MNRVESVSGVALLLVFFWPVADTIFSIYRRSLHRRAISQPDRLHYHQFVMRALEVVWLGRANRHIANPLATAVLMPMVAAPVVAGVMFWDNTPAAALSLLVLSTLFVGSYIVGVRLAPRFRRGSPVRQLAMAGE